MNSDDKGLCRIIRDNYREKLFGKAKGYGIQIEERSRIGRDMTVAILSSDFRELDKKGLIDIKKTAEKILKIQKMVSSI